MWYAEEDKCMIVLERVHEEDALGWYDKN